MMMQPACTKRPVVLVLLVISLFIGTVIATALEVGERAPDFTLPSTMGDDINLSQFKGKKYVLIQFYSMDFNPT
jgi:hypothetical protein